MKTEVWSVKEFMNREVGRIEATGVHKLVAGATALGVILSSGTVLASTTHPISTAFDHKLWPLMIDLGEPLAKTMMGIGVYNCIRNDVEKGWKMIYRAGVGLIGLYLIDGFIHIIQGVGNDLAS
jgi:hypothetical protein